MDRFSEPGFWQKLHTHARRVGADLLGMVLTLYYALHDSSVPGWAKTVIVGALGYFIAPIDLIPDAIPGPGYTDDAGVIAAALAAVALYVTDETKAKAKKKIEEWFG